MSRLTPTMDADSHTHAATTLALRALLHELRNTLTPISALAQVAQQHPHDKQIVALAMQSASQGCETAVRGAQRVLEIFACLDSNGAAETSSALSIVELAIYARRRLFPERDYSISLDGHDCMVDGVVLRLVLMNLLLNAEAASSPSSAIRVLICSTWNTAHGSMNSDHDRMVSIQVVDHGAGFRNDVKNEVRDESDAIRSYNSNAESMTTSRASSGLGLMICRKLLHSCGGRLEIRTKPGAGTTATILLPAKTNEQSRAA
jgi:signal transduction histidine kinase